VVLVLAYSGLAPCSMSCSVLSAHIPGEDAIQAWRRVPARGRGRRRCMYLGCGRAAVTVVMVVTVGVVELALAAATVAAARRARHRSGRVSVSSQYVRVAADASGARQRRTSRAHSAFWRPRRGG